MRLLRGAAGLLLLSAALELAARAGIVDPTVVPPASTTVAATARLLVDLEFLGHVGATLLAWGLGLAVATAVAVPAGALLGASRRARVAGTAAVELLRPIPSVALIPLAILLLGRGLDMKVTLVAYASAWPILINTLTGVDQVDPVARDTARSYGLGRVAVVRRVTLPSAGPFIFTGVRIAAAIALIVAISAELLAGGGTGIGTWMLGVSQAGAARELLYAGILVSGLLGLAINGVMLAGESRLFAWHHRRLEEAR